MTPPLRRSAEQLTEDALAIWAAGVLAVKGDRLIENQLQLNDHVLEIPEHEFEIDLSSFRRICVLGAGKAGRAMTLGLEQVLAPIADKMKLFGSVNIPQDGTQSEIDTKNWASFLDLRTQLQFEPKSSRWIELNQVRPPGANRVTALAVKKSAEILETARTLTPADLCIVLLSGGGSALLSSPIEGIDWQTKNETIDFLASRGAPIEQMNQVRTALSQVKGGGLLENCGAAMVLTLVISDVMGDPPATIASGPTCLLEGNSSPAADALQVIHQYDPQRLHIPSAVFETLSQRQTSPRHTNDCNIPEHHYFVLGNLAVAVDAAGVEAEKRGYSHVMHIQGPSEKTSDEETSPQAETEGQHMAHMLNTMQRRPGPDCLITGGEPVVDLSDATTHSLGGRNLQLTLSALCHWADQNVNTDKEPSNLCFISGGTDGEDGPTAVAGALITSRQIPRTSQQGDNAKHYQRSKDAFHFFQAAGGLLLTGATGTNVCDLRVGVVDRIQPQPDRDRS